MEWVGMPPSSQPEVSSPGGFGAVCSPVLLLVVTFKGVTREGRESVDWQETLAWSSIDNFLRA